MPILSRLLYTSTATAPLSQADRDDIVAVCRDHNARDGIFGKLLHAAGTFAQVLEGPVSVVERTFLRIERDRRHIGIDVIYRGAAGEHMSSSQPMEYCDLAWLTDEQRSHLGPLVRAGFSPVPSWQAVTHEGELLRAFDFVFGRGGVQSQLSGGK